MLQWKLDEEKKVGETKDGKWSKICERESEKKQNVGVMGSSYKRIRVRGDGNCFYRCISVQLYGTEERHLDVRNSVVDHLERHKSEFQVLY